MQTQKEGRAGMIASLSTGAGLPLFGRTEEQTMLRAGFDAARAGRGQLMFVAGEAGIGKTTLVTALARAAAGEGARVFVGRCKDVEPLPPYRLWRDLFAGDATASSPVSPPEAFTPRTEATATVAAAPLEAQLLAWLTALAQTPDTSPIVLMLEDLHWADAASLALLRALARAVAALPVLILATYRENELDRVHPLYALLPRFVRESDVARIALKPLTAADVSALVRARYALPDADAQRLARSLHARAEGNALFTTELLHALESDGVLRQTTGTWRVGDLTAAPLPPLLRQVIDERVLRLGPRAGMLLEGAAVIGGAVPLALWTRISGSDEDALLALIDDAVAARLLTVSADGATVQFVHALTREAWYAGIPLTRRRALHRAVAEALVAQAGAEPGVIAAHLQAAGDARARGWFLRAAARAEATAAFASATQYLEAALVLLAPEPETATQQAELHLRIAVLNRFGPWTTPHLHAALSLAQTTGDTALAAIAALHLGFSAASASIDLSDALARSRDALAILDALPADAVAGLSRIGVTGAELGAMHARYTQFAAATGWFDEVFAILGVARDASYVSRPLPDGSGYAGLAVAYSLLGRVADARAAFADCVAWFRVQAQSGSAAAFYEWELTEHALIYAADDRARCHLLADTAERYYAQDEAMPDVFSPRLARVGLLAHEGAWDDALALITNARATFGFSGWYGNNLRPLGEITRARGDHETAASVVREIFPAGPDTEPGGIYVRNALHGQRLAAALALDLRDHDIARLWLEAHDRWLAWSGAVLGQADGALAWGRYYRAIGDATRACVETERALALAAAPRQPLVLLAAHRVLGELAREAGTYREAASHLKTALTLADACGSPYERARTLIALGALQQAMGEPATAAATLAEARAVSGWLGVRFAPQPVAALASSAPTSAAPPLSHPEYAPLYAAGLTAREAEVLALLARGNTNSDIAANLSLSVRTVERHIANIYAKIGAHNRSAAVAYAVGVLANS